MQSAQHPLARVAPLVCGGALAAAAVLVTVHDPANGGGPFPACAFHQSTGLWCPGCGLTRATHHLLRGDVAGALGSNLFTPFVLVAIVVAWWAWTRWSFGRSLGRSTDRLITAARRAPRWSTIALLVVVVSYGVLRNVPASPFSALAP